MDIFICIYISMYIYIYIYIYIYLCIYPSFSAAIPDPEPSKLSDVALTESSIGLLILTLSCNDDNVYLIKKITTRVVPKSKSYTNM
jgi:hypothetical protein